MTAPSLLICLLILALSKWPAECSSVSHAGIPRRPFGFFAPRPVATELAKTRESWVMANNDQRRVWGEWLLRLGFVHGAVYYLSGSLEQRFKYMITSGVMIVLIVMEGYRQGQESVHQFRKSIVNESREWREESKEWRKTFFGAAVVVGVFNTLLPLVLWSIVSLNNNDKKNG